MKFICKYNYYEIVVVIFYGKYSQYKNIIYKNLRYLLILCKNIFFYLYHLIIVILSERNLYVNIEIIMKQGEHLTPCNG